jgi:copper oxidase (laccase) domain-containing protein
MHCGVAIGEANYEVGVAVIEQLGLGSTTGTRTVDLRQILARRAQAAGVGKVTLSPWCTYGDSQLFWSHRRNPAAAGRMIAYLGRPLT